MTRAEAQRQGLLKEQSPAQNKARTAGRTKNQRISE
jgi:hypothetical protein